MKDKSAKKMSQFADRPTVGQMLVDTAEEHAKQQIEVGEFIDEIGNKEVMTEIWKQIDARKGLKQWNHKFYIVVYFRKDTHLHRVIKCLVQCRHTSPLMVPGLTCFSYEPKKDQLLLEWILPDRPAFNTFLMTEATSDPFLIQCIKTYLSGKENKQPYIKV